MYSLIPLSITWNKRHGSQHWTPSWFFPLSLWSPSLWHAPRTAVANEIHPNPALVTMEQLKLFLWDASWLLHKGNNVSLFFVNPFGFLSPPIHADMHWTLASGGYSTDVWSPQKCGAHIPRQIPNSRAWNTYSAGTPKKRSVTLGCKMVLLPSSGMWRHARPWDRGRQRRVLWVKMRSSYSHGRTTTETFFLGQVKWPQWSSEHSRRQPENVIIYTHACGQSQPSPCLLQFDTYL